MMIELNNEIVVLIHGLMRSSKSMLGLGKHLGQQGYKIFLYDYPSTKHSIATHGAQLKHFIQTVALKNPDKKLHFITHSLGGIIAREALENLNQEQLAQCSCLIMLSPPNQGSLLATWFTKLFPAFSAKIKPMAELSCHPEAYIHRVPIPTKLSIGIIAGRFDIKTPPSTTHLKGQKDFIIVNSAHTYIMNHPKTRQAISSFLQSGTFSREFEKETHYA